MLQQVHYCLCSILFHTILELCPNTVNKVIIFCDTAKICIINWTEPIAGQCDSCMYCGSGVKLIFGAMFGLLVPLGAVGHAGRLFHLVTRTVTRNMYSCYSCNTVLRRREYNV